MSEEIKKDVLDSVAGGATNSELYFYYTVKKSERQTQIPDSAQQTKKEE